MALIRLIVFVTVFGCMILLLVQNLSPSLSVVFLGMRSRALPLAVWVLLSIVAGAVTSLAIISLLRLGSYGESGQQKSSRQKSSTRPVSSTRPQASVRDTTSASVGSQEQRSGQKGDRVTDDRSYDDRQYEEQIANRSNRANEEIDDWEQTSSEDWDFDDEPETKKSYQSSYQNQAKTRIEDYRDTPKDSRRSSEPEDEEFEDDLFEPDDEPKRKSNYDSTYSYNYREPQQTGVGKTESVYDADYRVLVPPYHPESADSPNQSGANQNQTDQGNDDNSSDDDWSFLDDIEDDEATEQSQTKPKKSTESEK